MSTPYIVFLTGGIASGKSLVGHYLETLGAVRIDLDELYHEILASDTLCRQQLVTSFGVEILSRGAIDRQALAHKVFGDPHALAELERITHPLVFCALKLRIQELCARSKPFSHQSMIVVEVPLINKVSEVSYLADEILALIAPMKARFRYAQVRGLSREQICARMRAQVGNSLLCHKSDTLILNAGSISMLQQHVKAWYLSRMQRIIGKGL
ncbi:dephospho-CoA kinase [Fannyhessea vaginae]|uniref:dephospho-CoA kinase n=1 Tax=Fannyhessea vaginae TaxID=82135 RepID=UPI003B21CC2B